MAESKSAALPLGYAPSAPRGGGPQLYSEGILRAMLRRQAALAGHGAGRYNAPSPEANPLGGIAALSLRTYGRAERSAAW
jgi:hypothetical protein